VNGSVDFCSGSYTAGSVTGAATAAPLSGAATAGRIVAARGTGGIISRGKDRIDRAKDWLYGRGVKWNEKNWKRTTPQRPGGQPGPVDVAKKIGKEIIEHWPF
jgi:hypothetical protein